MWRLFERDQQVAGAATTAPLFTTLAAPRRVPPTYPPVFIAHLPRKRSHNGRKNLSFCLVYEFFYVVYVVVCVNVLLYFLLLRWIAVKNLQKLLNIDLLERLPSCYSSYHYQRSLTPSSIFASSHFSLGWRQWWRKRVWKKGSAHTHFY